MSALRSRLLATEAPLRIAIPMLRLSCVAQNYEWGVHGSASAVGRMKVGGCGGRWPPPFPGTPREYRFSSAACAQAKGEQSLIDEEQPYAEYW